MGGEGKTQLVEEDIDDNFVRCKYYAVGCIEKIAKDELELHLTDQKEHHMRLLEDAVIEQAAIIDDQRNEITTQKHLSFNVHEMLLAPLLCFFESVKTFILSDLPAQYDNDLFQKMLKLIEPSEKDKNTVGIQGWHVIYVAVSLFILFCYAVSTALLARPLSPAQLLPATIFFVFVSIHLWNSKCLSSLANHIAAVYLTGVWMLLNIVLLPVF